MKFVLVDRVEFGDQMVIPDFVQEQYPDRFKIVVDKPEVVVPVVKQKKTPKEK